MSKLAEFCISLGDIPRVDNLAQVRIKSRDFFWFSPILRNQLEGRKADIVVKPRNKHDVVCIAAAAAKYRIPLTLRGGGTSCQGQSVPLAGGIVVDISDVSRLVWQRDNVLRVEAGASFLEIDRVLKPSGLELQMHPSTRKTATIGGFVASGKAGCGSCKWGQITEAGAVAAVEVVTVEEEPRVLRLSGADVGMVLQACGVNGIITEVEVPLAPCRPWAERVIAFATLKAAASFGQALGEAEGIAKKLISVHDARIAPMMKPLGRLVPEGLAMAIVMVAEEQADEMAQLARDFGGTVVYERSARAADDAVFRSIGAMPPLYEYTWNHTTLHALRVEPGLTYLELEFPMGANLSLLDEVRAVFGDSLLMHLEFLRRYDQVTCVAMPLLRYAGRERLYSVIARLQSIGVTVRNPHSYMLDYANWQQRGRLQSLFKAEADPHGLMNPGKLGKAPDASDVVDPLAERDLEALGAGVVALEPVKAPIKAFAR